MSIFEVEPKTREQRIGKRVYYEALYDRKGFHEFELDEDIWLEIFEAIGEEATAAVSAEDI